MTGITEWNGRSVNFVVKRVRDGLKKEKPIIEQGLAQEGSNT